MASTSTPSDVISFTPLLRPFFNEWYYSTSLRIKLNSASEIWTALNAFEINLLIESCEDSARETVFSCFLIFLFIFLFPRVIALGMKRVIQQFPPEERLRWLQFHSERPRGRVSWKQRPLRLPKIPKCEIEDPLYFLGLRNYDQPVANATESWVLSARILRLLLASWTGIRRIGFVSNRKTLCFVSSKELTPCQCGP